MNKNFILIAFLLVSSIVSVLAQPFYVRGEANGWAVDAAWEMTATATAGVYSLTVPASSPAGRKEFKVYDALTDQWHLGNNFWYEKAAAASVVTIKWNANTYNADVKDKAIVAMACPGAHNNWDNTQMMTKTTNTYCATFPTPGTWDWKPTRASGSWDSWEMCYGGNRSSNSGNWSVTTTTANQQVCLTYSPTTGRVTIANKITLATVATAVKCNGDQTGAVNLTATGTPATTGFSYAWSNQGTTEDLTGVAAGTYTATVSAPGYCPTTKVVTVAQPATAVSATVAVTGPVSSKYTATITATGGSPYTTGVTYRYRRSNGTTYTAFGTNPVFAGLVAGTYTFEARDKNLCVASEIMTVGTAALTASTNDASLTVSPNPAVEQLNVRLGLDKANGILVVTDILGRSILSQNVVNNAGETINLDVTTLAAGTYTLSFRANDGNVTTSLFVVTKN